MELFQRLFRALRRRESNVEPNRGVSPRRGLTAPETMEPRALLAVAPIHVGMVYFEQDSGSDQHGDLFELTFSGGAAGTRLSRLEVDGDQEIQGFSIGDVFFDTVEAGLGADHAVVFVTESAAGIQSVRATVSDGGMKLVLDFEGFDAGETLRFSIDVDEVQEFDPGETDITRINEGIDPITSGVEFQGSHFTASFTAPEFFGTQATAEFRNRYDEALLASGLELPADDSNGRRDRSAGAFAELTQTPIPAGLQGYVYHDRNNNGLRESGEEGLAGVRIRLVTLESVVERSDVEVTTDARGFYEIQGLVAGRYKVVEVVQPAGFLDGLDTAGKVAGQTRGIALDDVLDDIVLRGGEQGSEFNFGELRPVSLEGNVHLATREGDCFGETGFTGTHQPVVGARVLLYDTQGTLLRETLTDAQGHYAFNGLAPGAYRVVEITPDGLIDGGPHLGSIVGLGIHSGRLLPDGSIDAIVLASGQKGVDYDFCEFVPADLSGFVYHDRDLDGVREPGEAPLAGVTVKLLGDGGRIVATTTTDAEGAYHFTRLRAGTYTVVEEQPSGWRDGIDAPGTIGGTRVGRAINPGDRLEEVRILWGDHGIHYNFGEFLSAAIRGQVCLADRDGDCFGEEAEHAPVVGAVVRLRDAQGTIIATTVTDSDGKYAFVDLLPGNYTVEELTPDGLFDGGAMAGQIAGQTRGTVEGGGKIRDIAIFSGEQGNHYDFCERPPARISGYVYHDRDQDGRRDDGEPPIANVLVELVNAQGEVVASTRTNPQGFYKFEGIAAGTYALRETQPAGWLDGLDTPGILAGTTSGRADLPPGDWIRAIEIGWGDQGIEFNFGEILPGRISGIVHSDLDRDCVFEPEAGELPLSGVTLELRDARGTLIATTVTDSQGKYTFAGIPPGEYSVTESQPAGYFEGGATPGSHGGTVEGTNRIAKIQVGSSQSLTDYDFCEVPPIRISGFVFQDGAALVLEEDEPIPERIRDFRDGQLTPDDIRLANVVLELRQGVTGVPIQGSAALPGTYSAGPIRATTDQNGFYQFVGLPFGNYAVYEVHPEGLIDGVDTPGTSSGVVFNPGEPQNQAIRQALIQDPENDAIVQIPLPAGTHASNYNFSEVKVIRRPPAITQPPLPPTRLPPLALPPGLPPPPLSPLPPGLLAYLRSPIPPFYAPGPGHTWHLSVVDAGTPRGEGFTITPSLSKDNSIWLTAISAADRAFQSQHLRDGEWVFQASHGQAASGPRIAHFGAKGGIPISGDFNGDGRYEIGIYHEGEWCIDVNGNGRWDAEDLWAKLGNSSDLPVTGDWDGDGKHDIGIFGHPWEGDLRAIDAEPGLPDEENPVDGFPKNPPPPEELASNGRRVLKRTAQGAIRTDVIDHVFRYGRKGDLPVAGDWNGDGIATIGIFRAGNWYLDVDGNGRFDKQDAQAKFGDADSRPLVGDFNGDGVDEIAFYRDGRLYIDSNGNREWDDTDQVVVIGKAGDRLVAGDWNGDGRDEVAVYRGGEPLQVAERTSRP